MDLHPKVGKARRRHRVGFLRSNCRLPRSVVFTNSCLHIVLDPMCTASCSGVHPRMNARQRKVELVLQERQQRAPRPTRDGDVQSGVAARIQRGQRAVGVLTVDPGSLIRGDRVVKRASKRIDVAVVRRRVEGVRRAGGVRSGAALLGLSGPRPPAALCLGRPPIAPSRDPGADETLAASPPPRSMVLSGDVGLSTDDPESPPERRSDLALSTVGKGEYSR